MVHKILFLDCDGTIREPKSGAKFISSPTDQQVIKKAKGAIKYYHSEGWQLIGVTNQGGVAAKHKSIGDAISEQVETLRLIPELDYIYFAPTYEGLDCWKVTRESSVEIKQYSVAEFDSFRKPGAGMLNLALRFYEAKPKDCLMVGDREEDQQAAVNAGVPFLQMTDWWEKQY